jgi:membrane-associated PAP2 superfamily phosphatase
MILEISQVVKGANFIKYSLSTLLICFEEIMKKPFEFIAFKMP